jgi:hypothetical protein
MRNGSRVTELVRTSEARDNGVTGARRPDTGSFGNQSYARETHYSHIFRCLSNARALDVSVGDEGLPVHHGKSASQCTGAG